MSSTSSSARLSLIRSGINSSTTSLRNSWDQQAQELAALQERQRLARELHDSVSQALYGIGLGAHTAREALESSDAEQIKASLEYVLALAEAGLFDPAGPFPGHLGLRSMRERAERVGGTLRIESVPGQGTCVCARVAGRGE